jgi:hypothetical protein
VRAAAPLLLALLLAACAARGGPLVLHPDGTVDTTHGAEGAQTTPR